MRAAVERITDMPALEAEYFGTFDYFTLDTLDTLDEGELLRKRNPPPHHPHQNDDMKLFRKLIDPNHETIFPNGLDSLQNSLSLPAS